MNRGRAGPRPVTEKEQYYRGLLRKQKETGLSLREIADQEGILPVRLRGWKYRITKLDQEMAKGTTGRPQRGRQVSKEPTPEAAEAAAEPAPARPSALLLPVRVVSGTGGAPVAAAADYEVLLRGGHLVRVPHSFEPDSLRRLVQVLEAAC